MDVGFSLVAANLGQADEVALDAYDATIRAFDTVPDAEHRPHALAAVDDPVVKAERLAVCKRRLQAARARDRSSGCLRFRVTSVLTAISPEA